jgi:tight adherence protein B
LLLPVLLTFIAVFLVFASVVLAVMTVKESPKFALRMRLRNMALGKDSGNIPDDIRKEILKETPAIERLLSKFRLFNYLDNLITHAGLNIQLNVLIIYTCTATLLMAIIVYVFSHKALFAIAVTPIVFLIAISVLLFKKKKREEALTEQLPDLLMMVSRSLRAGHTVSSAIELVGMEMSNPAGELFKAAYEQQKLGMRITEALTGMTSQVESLDLRFFITTIQINSEIGGNLSETLDQLAKTIRERLNVRRQVRVFTAQGRMSGYVLAALPIVVFIAFNILNPSYEKLLIDEKIGNYMLIFAVVLQFIGFLFIRKIINIRI